MTSCTRALAMALAISALSLGAAYADDEYGTGREPLIGQSAASAPSVPLSTAQAKMVAKAFDYHGTYPVPATPSWASPQRPHYATSAAMPPARDFVGDGGAQDELALAIHQTGSGTDW